MKIMKMWLTKQCSSQSKEIELMIKLKSDFILLVYGTSPPWILEEIVGVHSTLFIKTLMSEESDQSKTHISILQLMRYMRISLVFVSFSFSFLIKTTCLFTPPHITQESSRSFSYYGFLFGKAVVVGLFVAGSECFNSHPEKRNG